MNAWKAGRQERAHVSGDLGGALSGWRKSSEGCSWGGSRGQTPKALSAVLKGLAFKGCKKPTKNLKHDRICFGQYVVVVAQRIN